MEVREEDLLELDEADVAAQELALRPLGAVEEQPVSPAPDERRGQGALGGRRGSGRPEEDDVEIHGGRVYALKYRASSCRYSVHGVTGVSLGWVDEVVDPALDLRPRVRGHPRGRRVRALVGARRQLPGAGARGQRARRRALLGLRALTDARSGETHRREPPREAETRADRRGRGRAREAHRLVAARSTRALDPGRTARGALARRHGDDAQRRGARRRSARSP